MLRPGVSRAAGDPLTQKSAEAPTFQDLLEVGYSESFLDVGPMGPLGVERPGSPGCAAHPKSCRCLSRRSGSWANFSHLFTLHFDPL